MKSVSILASLLASVVSAQIGNAWVENHCGFPVFLKSVSEDRSDAQNPQVIQPGQSWREDILHPSRGGISIKLSRDRGFSEITQFEYHEDTNTPRNRLWYDASNVNCDGSRCPFYDGGMYLYNLDNSCNGADYCRPAYCSPGQPACGGNNVYVKWNDDRAMRDAAAGSSLVLRLCTASPPNRLVRK
jgi:hypothetical protein